MNETDTVASAQVANVMQRDIIQFPAYATMGEAVETFVRNKIAAAPVVDECGRCVGVISAIDFVRWAEATAGGWGSQESSGRTAPVAASGIAQAAAARGPGRNEWVTDHMSCAVQTISADSTIHQATAIMVATGLHHLPVVDDKGRPVGWLSSLDLLRALPH